MLGGGDLLGAMQPQQDAFGGFPLAAPTFPTFIAWEDESLCIGFKSDKQMDGSYLMTS